MEKLDYDRKRSIFSHKKGKAMKFGEAWVDHFIKFGCDPDLKALYMKIVADKDTRDKEDGELTEEEVEDGVKKIDARNAAYTFIRRYGIKEWVTEQKSIQAANYSALVKNDYVAILNAIVCDTNASYDHRMKAMQQVTKMLGIEGASKVEASGGFSLNMDYRNE